jgi:hypothetical protein
MNTLFQLNIPKPCHERWEDFSPTASGGFCGACQKNVIDFTTMSDSQLVAFFRDNLNRNDLCGRFRENQLQKNYDIDEWYPDWRVEDNTVLYEVSVAKTQQTLFLPVVRHMQLVRNIAAAVLLFTSVEQSLGQNTQISGKIVDSEGNPMPGVSIRIKGTTKGTSSDMNGNYQIAVDSKDVLIYSSVGFQIKEVSSKDKQPVVQMREEIMGMSEVVVKSCSNVKGMLRVGGISVKREQWHEPSFPKCFTQLKVLGNPTVKNEVEIVPEIDAKSKFDNMESHNLAKLWYSENAFQHIENVMVYDLSGRNFEISYTKVGNQKIIINLSQVPMGLCIIRITYANELNPDGPESSAVRVMVLK